MSRYLMMALGGALGAITRYHVTLAVQSRGPVAFPFGTFVVNITGCFVMGVVVVMTERFDVHPNWRYLVPVGFIGAYTTFSTFELETFTAGTTGAWPLALGYVVSSVVIGYLALWAGYAAARAL